MKAQRIATLMSQLKGCPLSVLIVMGYFDRCLGRDELAMLTDYSPPSVQKALERLEFLGLAQNHGRYEGWLLTTKARQLPLFAQGELPTEANAAEVEAEGQVVEESSEVKKIFVDSSSSSHEHDSKDKDSLTTNYQLQAEVKKLYLDADGEAAVRALMSTGMPESTRNQKGARDAVSAAVQSGLSGADVLASVNGWLAYVAGNRGNTIKHAGFFTASRIRRGLEAPAPRSDPKAETVSRDELARRFIAEEMARRGG